jgi:hypothetical protein
MALEPLMAITLLLCVTGVTLHVTHMLAHRRLVAAIVMPIELACICAVLSMRFERRAQVQEYMLTELVLWVKGDLAQAFPLRPQRARDRIEAETPVLRQLAQDLLEIGRESPCAVSRVMSAWVALVLAGGVCGQWAWNAVLHEGPVALLAGVAITPGVVVFALAFNDLRRGYLRRIRNPREVRMWAQGYQPAREPTILPTVPVMLLCFVPAMIIGAMWSNGSSLQTHLSVTEAALALWLLLWNGRKAASSKAFVCVEQGFAPLDRFIRNNVARGWDLVSRTSRVCGWSAAGLLALSFSWPTSLDQGASSTLISVGSWLLTASLLLGLLMLNPWQRPVSPVTYSARDLLSRQGKLQEQRITTFLNVAFGCSLLAVIVTVGAA